MPSAREREDSATEMKTAMFRLRGEGNRTDAAPKYGKGATVR